MLNQKISLGKPLTMSNQLSRPLLFVLGKGGVGRTTVSTALALSYAQQNKKVLLVQWTLQDVVSPAFGFSPCGHDSVNIYPNLFTMNYSASKAIQEYFVDHLKMKLLYNIVIENKHVQKLIESAPGIQELFFLGRLFWLIEVAIKERGWTYDQIVVDAPATGHGVSLFNVAPTIAKLGMTGPLAKECERVTTLLNNPDKTGFLFVTLPEELPYEETTESLPKLISDLKQPPYCIVLNRSTHLLWESIKTTQDTWLEPLWNELEQRDFYEEKTKAWGKDHGPVVTLPELSLTHPHLHTKERFLHLAEVFHCL
jgi:anion-transporting  ArsA/GET3 family ATPase